MILIHDISTKKTDKGNIVHQLNELIKSFLSSHPEYINKIEKILLLNFSESIINPNEFRKYLSRINTNARKGIAKSRFSSEFIELLSDAVIINFSSIFPRKGLKQINSKKNIYYIQNLNISLLKEIIGNSKSIFFYDRITPIFAQVLNSLDELVGYYSGLKARGRWCTEIKDPKRFLEIVTNLNRLSDELFDANPQYDNSKSYLDILRSWKINKDEKSQLVKSAFYKKFKVNSSKKNSKLFLYGGDRYLSDKFIIQYQYKRGKFGICDCEGDNLLIEENKPGYFFDNIDGLTGSNRLGLFKFIKSEQATDYTIILRSPTYPNDVSFLNFEKIDVPSMEMIFPKLPMFFYKMLKEKKAINNKEVIEKQKFWFQYLRSSILVTFYKSLTTLYELDLLIDYIVNESEITIDPRRPDFWYELLDDQKLEAVRQQISEEKKKVFRPKNDNLFVFRRKPNKHFEIVFNSQPIYPNNPNSDGLFYIYSIIKQAAYEPIPVKTLYELKLGIRQKKSKKEILSSDDAGTFGLVDNSESVPKVPKEIILKRLMEEKKHIEENLKQAKMYAPELVDEFNKQLIEIEEEINRVKYGKKKNLDKNRKKAIDKALKEAKDQFKNSHPEFYEFLIKNIVYNPYEYSYSYKYTDNIVWVLE